MPTKNGLIGILIGYGFDAAHEPYLDQLFDRHILAVRKLYPEIFKKIEVFKNAFNYNELQTLYILDELRKLTDHDYKDPGYTLSTLGCTSESISRAMYEYRDKLKVKIVTPLT